jgi:iron(III) transport system ATP-binding protein
VSAAFEFADVSKRFGDRVVLDGFTLELERGKTLALLGPSGSGKTTVLRLLAGFESPDAGTISIAGHSVSGPNKIHVPPEERETAVVFQDLGLWPHLTCAQHLEFCLRARRTPRADRAPQVRRTLSRIGLDHHSATYPGSLSGGERQRLAIARALLVPGRTVLLDEPFSNLDVVLKHELLALLRESFQADGATALFVTHDLREAASLAENVAVLEQGRLSQLASLHELCAAPATDFIRLMTSNFTSKETPL